MDGDETGWHFFLGSPRRRPDLDGLAGALVPQSLPGFFLVGAGPSPPYWHGRPGGWEGRPMADPGIGGGRSRSPRRPARRLLRAAAWLALALVLAAGAGGLWLRARLRASLPQEAGERVLPGLG